MEIKVEDAGRNSICIYVSTIIVQIQYSTPSISFYMSLGHKILVYFSTIIWSETSYKKIWR